VPTPLPRTRAALRALLDERGLRPSRRRGQCFLVDAALADAIVADAGVGPRDWVIEIGPGAGGLTQPLLDAAARVTAIEIDRGLAALLRDGLGEHAGLLLVEGDVLADGPGRLHPAVSGAIVAVRASDAYDRVLVVANLPYSCGTPALVRLLRLPDPPDDIVAMLQQELVDRMLAAPGSREYGPLAVLCALRGSVERLRDVPPDVFYPRPSVQSAVFRLTPLREWPAHAERAVELASRAFQQRRKRVARALRGVVAHEALEAAGIDPDLRPERIAPEEWVRLAGGAAG
jgi:16S rRNA (adenine1518-N6/adenine1519-N6)-dimethyltransferase